MRARRWWVLGAAAALAMAATALPAAGYVRSRTSEGEPLRWNRTCVTVSLFAGDPPPPLDAATLETAVRAATEAWSADLVPCTALRLLLSTSPLPSADAVFDRRNSVTFRRTEWRREPCDDGGGGCVAYDPNAMAVTTIFALANSGEILDADIEINAVSTLWTDVARDGAGAGIATSRGPADVQNVLTHELGHLIGLDHSPLPESAMFATGAPGETKKRHLAHDDVDALCDVYPRESDLTCAPRPERPVPAGGCSVPRGVPRGSGRGGVPLALVALALTVACRRRCSPSPAERSPFVTAGRDRSPCPARAGARRGRGGRALSRDDGR